MAINESEINYFSKQNLISHKDHLGIHIYSYFQLFYIWYHRILKHNQVWFEKKTEAIKHINSMERNKWLKKKKQQIWNFTDSEHFNIPVRIL